MSAGPADGDARLNGPATGFVARASSRTFGSRMRSACPADALATYLGSRPHAEVRNAKGSRQPAGPLDLLERETGFGPATLSLGSRSRQPAPGRTKPQVPVITAPRTAPDRHGTYQAACKNPFLADTLADAAGQAPPRFLSEPYLIVRDVAERLRVSTATVYSLCRRNELAHYRISNAIRIPERYVARYLASAGDGGSSNKTGSGQSA